MFNFALPHPVLTVVNLAMGSATAALAVSRVPHADPNLAAFATIMGAAATIFSGWVAYRHPARKSRSTRSRKPRAISPEKHNQK